jgi:hypothetical protein
MDRLKPAIASPASFFQASANSKLLWVARPELPAMGVVIATPTTRPSSGARVVPPRSPATSRASDCTSPIVSLRSRSGHAKSKRYARRISTHLLRPLSRATQGTTRMERVHPKVGFATTCAMIALALSISGCRSSSTGIAGSPFMSPDRVPPPNTRALQPGQAQPYYQGDPLPAMQSAANGPATSIATLPNEVDSRTASGRTLAWAQPGAAAPPSSQISLAPTAPLPQTQSIAAAGEASVAVPNDGDPLRFPPPAPHTQEVAAPIASAVPTPAQPRSVQPVAVQPPPNVLQASYDAPIPSALPLPAQVTTPPQQVASPWRAPHVAQAAPAPAYASQPDAMQPNGAASIGLPAPPVIPANAMAATLRAVEAPAQPGDPMPRVRMPGYVASQVSADGFRPRTNMQ